MIRGYDSNNRRQQDLREETIKGLRHQQKREAAEMFQGGFEGPCTGERSLLATMNITADMLESLESRVGHLHSLLFGPEPCAGDTCCGDAPSARTLVGRAYESSGALQKAIDDIIHRLAHD